MDNFSSFIEQSKQNVCFLKSLIDTTLLNNDNNLYKSNSEVNLNESYTMYEEQTNQNNEKNNRNKWFCENCRRRFPNRKKLINHRSTKSCIKIFTINMESKKLPADNHDQNLDATVTK